MSSFGKERIIIKILNNSIASTTVLFRVVMLSRLPSDLLGHVFGFMDFKSADQFMATSKYNLSRERSIATSLILAHGGQITSSSDGRVVPDEYTSKQPEESSEGPTINDVCLSFEYTFACNVCDRLFFNNLPVFGIKELSMMCYECRTDANIIRCHFCRCYSFLEYLYLSSVTVPVLEEEIDPLQADPVEFVTCLYPLCVEQSYNWTLEAIGEHGEVTVIPMIRGGYTCLDKQAIDTRKELQTIISGHREQYRKRRERRQRNSVTEEEQTRIQSEGMRLLSMLL